MSNYRTLRAQFPTSKKENVRFYYWDIESWGLNPANPAFIVVMPQERYTKRMPKEWVFYDGSSMREWIDSLPKGFNHVFYAHNGNNFDIYALFDVEELVSMKKIASDSTIYTFFYGQNVLFRDSYHLLQAPLKTYGAKGITPKKFIDSNHPQYGDVDSINDDDLNYCRLDVQILRDAMNTLRGLYQEWSGRMNAELPLTSASLCYRVFCSKYWPNEWVWTKPDTEKVFYSATFLNEANECAKNAYYGGRVMVFPNVEGVELQNVMSFDRNSMYPSEMLKPLPNPDSVFKAEPTIGRVHRLKKDGSPYWGEFVLEADSNAELFLPQMVNGKAEYLGKSFDGFLMYPELNYALEHGWTLKEVRTLYRSRPLIVFEEYVNYFYNLRLEMKKNKDPRQSFVKILLNALYGKFGSKDRCERIEGTDEISLILEREDWREHYELKGWTLEPDDGFYLVGLEPTIKPKCNFFPIASAITSYARVELQKTISKCQNNGLKVAYCDTDSVHIYDLKEGQKIPIDIGGELGQWDLERPKDFEKDFVPKAIYYERKAYSWFDEKGKPFKIKHKGVSESDGDLTKAQFNKSVRKYKTAKRRGLEAGVEVITEKRSKRWYNENNSETKT